MAPGAPDFTRVRASCARFARFGGAADATAQKDMATRIPASALLTLRSHWKHEARDVAVGERGRKTGHPLVRRGADPDHAPSVHLRDPPAVAEPASLRVEAAELRERVADVEALRGVPTPTGHDG